MKCTPLFEKVRQQLQAILGTDWSRFHPWVALRCVLTLAAILAAGILAGQTQLAVIAAGGAFSVGFGSFQTIGRSHVRPMALAAAGMAAASWLGTLAANSSIASVVACGGAGLFYAFVARYGQAALWLGLQCAIWLVISTAYPATGRERLMRGVLVLAGGICCRRA